MAIILITGGTGVIGKALQEFLPSKGHRVIVLTRGQHTQQQDLNPNISYANWDVEKSLIDKEAIAKADYIIHLAGASVAEKRWTDKRKQEIVDSRTKSSALLVSEISEMQNNIKAVISASGIGWYGPDTKTSKQKGFTEDDPAAADFLGETCKQWEASIQPVAKLNKRLVIFRFGIVLSKTGGALEEFKKPLKFGTAAILGSGKQLMSWIHIDDLCRLLLFAIEHEEISGVYNAVAPKPVTNKALTLILANKIRNKYFVPIHVPEFVLKVMLGEMSVEVLKSATVNNEKIRKAGFTFLYPAVETALENLV